MSKFKSKEEAERVLDSVLKLALHMLVGGIGCDVVVAMIQGAKWDVEIDLKAEMNLPIVPWRMCDSMILALGIGEKTKCINQLREYMGTIKTYDNVWKKPTFERREPENWQELSAPYQTAVLGFGGSVGLFEKEGGVASVAS